MPPPPELANRIIAASFAIPTYGEEPPGPDLPGQFATILRDGPK